MIKKFIFISFALMLALMPATALARPAAQLDAQQNEVTLQFPDLATFSAELSASSDIQSVELEYGTEQLTCGDVVAKAFPQITPGKKVSAEWTWDMRQSGSLPPGATIWWRWRGIDSNGQELVSETKTTTWLDDVHKWQTITSGDLRLHYYKGGQSFANTIMEAAQSGLAFNAKETGLKPDGAIDLYIYASTDDMREAMLYEPSWTGGRAYPEHNIVVIGIDPNSSEEVAWGKLTATHELTHVLIGHLTFSCLGSLPQWLSEGLASYSEGEFDPVWEALLNQAIKTDTLLTVRSISGSFAESSEKARLSYGQSYSLVQFLIETYGQDKMTELLINLRDGATTDEALQKVYGFDIDGLEVKWREAIGAKPRAAASAPTAQPTPTFVPTIVPFNGSQPPVTSTPLAVPTSSFDGSNNPTPIAPNSEIPALPDAPQWIWAATIILLLCCCMVVILLIGAIVFFVTRKRSQP
jgi:hypothetical protein